MVDFLAACVSVLNRTLFIWYDLRLLLYYRLARLLNVQKVRRLPYRLKGLLAVSSRVRFYKKIFSLFLYTSHPYVRVSTLKCCTGSQESPLRGTTYEYAFCTRIFLPFCIACEISFRCFEICVQVEFRCELYWNRLGDGCDLEEFLLRCDVMFAYNGSYTLRGVEASFLQRRKIRKKLN